MRTIIRKWILLISLVVLLPVWADEPKAIDMTKALLDEHGKPARDFAEATKDDPQCESCPVLTIGVAIARALNMINLNDREDVALTGDQKWAMSELAARIRNAKEARLTVKEAEVIERRIGKAYTGPTIRQLMPVIDPNKKVPALE